VVTVIISAVGLLFASVAAIAAMATVALTIAYAEQANVRRLAEALLTLRGAARDYDYAVRTPTGEIARREREYSEALAEVHRVTALPVGSVMELGGVWLTRLANPDDDNNWKQHEEDADHALRAIQSWQPEPGWRLLLRSVRELFLRVGGGGAD
jgi:hypothetical protein